MILLYTLLLHVVRAFAHGTFLLADDEKNSNQTECFHKDMSGQEAFNIQRTTQKTGNVL